MDGFHFSREVLDGMPDPVVYVVFSFWLCSKLRVSFHLTRVGCNEGLCLYTICLD